MTIDTTSTRTDQYTAAAAQTIFNYTYKIFEETDLLVYQTPVGQTPNPATDILVLNTNYTVTGVNTEGGGTVVLTVGATAGDVITIVSNVSQDQQVNFSVGGKFSPDQVEFVIDKLTVLDQELSSEVSNRGLLYDNNAQVGSARKDNILPVLPLPSTGKIPIWTKNSSGSIAALELDENTDASTLRSELADDGPGTDGARLVGYSNGTSPSDDTVKKALDDLYSDSGTNTTNITANAANLKSRWQKNWLAGANFSTAPWQRGTSFTAATTPANNDATYLADRWLLLSDGNDVVDVSQTGTKNQLQFTVVTPNKKFGLFQIIEAANVRSLLGVVDQLSMGVFLLSSVNHTFKMALLKWTGTSDSPTKDPVSAWNGATVDPTLVANWEYVTPTSLSMNTTSTDQFFRLENIDASAVSSQNNLGVFFWLDDTSIAAAETVDCFGVKLTTETKVDEEFYEDVGVELTRCQRYYQQSYNRGVSPGTVTDNGRVAGWTEDGETFTLMNFRFNTSMRVEPTITWYSTTSGASGNIRDITNATDRTVSSTNLGVNGVSDITLGSSPPGPVEIHYMMGQFTLDAELGV